MAKIAVISDNHSYFGDEIIEAVAGADEIWHAGDIGDLASVEPFKKIASFRAVFGNIDDSIVRSEFPLDNVFLCEQLTIFMTHIGGYPGKYTARALQKIREVQPEIFISGHSHICKIMPDKVHHLLHINPGAYGHHGFHRIRTIVRFEINGNKIENMRVIELGLRGRGDHLHLI